MYASTCVCVLGVISSLTLPPVTSLENGLARTPPMGWLSWERFRCNTDCKNDPDNCISERLFRTMADLVVSEGYAAAGYEYVNIDDCWLEKERSADGQLVPDRERFSRGIKDLSDYIHSKGLKFGIYEDLGNYTCAGYPGITNPYMESDALTFASWNVDYVKLDGCYSLPRDMDRGYPEFGYYLNRTGRPMVYSCSWPVYQIYAGITPNFKSIIESCNLWRNFDDIQDSWQSLESIIDYYGNNQDTIIANAGPGHFNDPDMLIIGNFGLSYEQSKTQMAMWAILAAPLLMSVDLRTIRPEYKAILQNRKVIAVDQDPLGIQGRRIYKHRGIEIWARPITPLNQNYFSYAIAFLNRRTDGTPSDIAVTLRELGLGSPTGYHVEDLYEDVSYGILNPSTKIKVKVNPSGVVILRADVQATRAVPQRFSAITPVDDNRISYTPYVPQSTARTPAQRQDPGFVQARAPLSDFIPRARQQPLPALPPVENDFQPGQSTARPPLLRQTPNYIIRQENQIPNDDFQPGQSTARPSLRQEAEFLNQIPLQRRENVPLQQSNFVVQRPDINYVQQPTARVPVATRPRVDPFQAYRAQPF